MATQWSNKFALTKAALARLVGNGISPLGNLAVGALVLTTKRDSHCSMTGSACGLDW